MKDLISVIIPAYNVEKYISSCIKSILSQSYNNLEVIIINDGSTDRTRKLLDELMTKDNRIKVIHQENQGVSVARNNGLKLATGSLIGFVDADDEIEKDMYELLYHNMQKYIADISHCGFELVKPKETIKFHDTGIVLVQDKFDAIKELLSGKRIEPGIWNKLYRKSVIENVFFPADIKINEDLLFNIQVFKNADTIVFEDVVKYQYNFNPNSASRSAQVLERSKDIFEVTKRIKAILQESEIKDAVDNFYAGKLLASLKSLKSANLFATAIAQSHRRELRNINTENMGLRIRTLKRLLLDFPFFYNSIVGLYDVIFAGQQKWKNH